MGNGHGDSSSILGEAVSISHSTNTARKGINPTVLFPAIGELSGKLGSLTKVWQPV